MSVDGQRYPAIGDVTHWAALQKTFHESPLGFAFLKKATAAPIATHSNPTSSGARAHLVTPSNLPKMHTSAWPPWEPLKSPAGVSASTCPSQENRGWTGARWGDFCKNQSTNAWT